MSLDQCWNCGTPVEQPATGRRRKWCSEKCRKAPRTSKVSPVSSPAISPAVDTLLDRLAFAEDDPRAVAGLLLRRMAAGVDADPGVNVGLARETRQLLQFLLAIEVAGPGEVDPRQVEFLRQRIMSGLSR